MWTTGRRYSLVDILFLKIYAKYRASMNPVTFVTGLYDIQREKIDGRSIERYLSWLRDGLQLDVPFIVFTSPDLAPKIRKMRKDRILIVEKRFEELEFYHYIEKMRINMRSKMFRDKMMNIERIEASHPEYLAVVFSKFSWLNQAMHFNPFQSKYFFWMDAGCSRFFPKSALKKFQMRDLSEFGEKIILQRSERYGKFDPMENLYWENRSMISAGMFGGCIVSLRRLVKDIRNVFQEMLKKGSPNTEEIALQIMVCKEPNRFHLVDPVLQEMLPIFYYIQKIRLGRCNLEGFSLV